MYGAPHPDWRKANFEFSHHEFGGYLPLNDVHPTFADVLPPRDAYKKRTCVWCSPTFRMPPKRPVTPVEVTCASIEKGEKTYAPAFAKLGGNRPRTKDIRSATPRGFSMAVFRANQS